MKLEFEFAESENLNAKLRVWLEDDFSPEELDDMSTEQMVLEYLVPTICSNLEYDKIPLTMIDGKIIEED